MSQLAFGDTRRTASAAMTASMPAIDSTPKERQPASRTWRKAHGGADRKLLAAALFERIDVLGLQDATVYLTALNGSPWPGGGAA